MLNLICKISGPTPLSEISDTVALPYETRCRTRLRVTLASGREAGIVLPRSEKLRHGDCLQAEDGSVVRVIAAEESLLEAKANELLTLTRAVYHLGNRHVPVQMPAIKGTLPTGSAACGSIAVIPAASPNKAKRR